MEQIGYEINWRDGTTTKMVDGEIVTEKTEIVMENMYKELRTFRKYVKSFYGTDSELYPMNASAEQIYKVCEVYRISCDSEYTAVQWGDGDSVDRERVRDILFAMGYDWKVNNKNLNTK